MNNKISEKAIWEGAITPDNDTPSLSSQMQTQPYMMFCYKCNNVIPGDSKYCPFCKIELFVICPKCGVKYSSQYPICSQCGTDRQEYLAQQQRERERKEAIEKEKRRQREIEEHRRLEEERRKKEAEEEKERQKRIEAYREQERLKPQKEAYNAENEKIMASYEYRTTYSLLSKALEDYNNKNNNLTNGIAFFMLSLILTAIIPPVGAIAAIISLFMMFTGSLSSKEEYLKKYIQKKNDFDKDMIDRTINIVVKNGQINLSNCCIIAYREKHGLTVNYSWHW